MTEGTSATYQMNRARCGRYVIFMKTKTNIFEAHEIEIMSPQLKNN